MFSVYGITGRVFRGSRDQLGGVSELAASRRVSPIGVQNEESAITSALPLSGRRAVSQYASHPERERGPVHQCREVMSSPVITVASGETVANAWTLLHEHHIHQCPVVDGSRLVGLVSDRDLLRLLIVDGDTLRGALLRPVASVMRTPVITAEPDTDLRHLTELLLSEQLDGVPIVDGAEKLVGFVSKTDILRAVSTEPMLSLWR
ncbi:CBS domain-containing protein [Chitinilyticum litopenaei]|uniref:CBS domain-containing protein n=1 Tax=Chitinilyticum litopenaei TaxID=1121276 RepID=UPI0004151EE5|nr:CBS domain-containing protein [Chitinilyticum litopenaei]